MTDDTGITAEQMWPKLERAAELLGEEGFVILAARPAPPIYAQVSKGDATSFVLITDLEYQQNDPASLADLIKDRLATDAPSDRFKGVAATVSAAMVSFERRCSGSDRASPPQAA